MQTCATMEKRRGRQTPTAVAVPGSPPMPVSSALCLCRWSVPVRSVHRRIPPLRGTSPVGAYLLRCGEVRCRGSIALASPLLRTRLPLLPPPLLLRLPQPRCRATPPLASVSAGAARTSLLRRRSPCTSPAATAEGGDAEETRRGGGATRPNPPSHPQPNPTRRSDKTKQNSSDRGKDRRGWREERGEKGEQEQRQWATHQQQRRRSSLRRRAV